MLNICVSFDFSIMKKLWDLAHEKLVNILGGHCVGSNIYGCQPYLKIAIYVLKSTNGGLFYTPLYVLTYIHIVIFIRYYIWVCQNSACPSLKWCYRSQICSLQIWHFCWSGQHNLFWWFQQVLLMWIVATWQCCQIHHI